ncbi:MAG: hypothetical protein IT288_11975 [Bdellovibrionales bacterium]|nr:hypothetical protein [Bdellovibrionales bacterium]
MRSKEYFQNLGRALVLIVLSQGVAVSAFGLKVEVSSEGYVVTCSESGKASTRLLDFFEGERFQSQFPRHESYVYDKVRWSLSRIEPFHPKLSGQLAEVLKTMPSQVVFISGEGIGADETARPAGLPLSCQVSKAVFRSASTDKKFSIRKDLWDRLAMDDQAGLIFHALLADHFQSQGAKLDIAQVRSLVRLWSQGGPSEIGMARYVYALRGLESLLGEIRLNGMDYRLDAAHPLSVYDNGQVAQGTMSNGESTFTYKAEQGYELQLTSKRGPVQLSFHPTGVPRRALLQEEVVEIPIQGRKLKFKYEVAFHPNGQVQQGYFLSEYGLFLRMADGRLRRFKNMEYHMGIFDEAGNLISARRLSNANKPIDQK